MPLDAQVEELLKEAETLGLPCYDTLTPEEARRQIREGTPAVDPELSVERVEDRRIPGPGGEIPVRVYAPAAGGPLPVVVWFHGGGWVVGDLETHHALCHALARLGGCAVVAVDYRLAPEHRFPAAVEDAFAATRWTAENARSIGVDPGRIAVAGDSAGGNLAAVVALLARDASGPPLRFQLLVYPITDCDLDTPSYRECAEGYLLTRPRMAWFWDHYMPRVEDRGDFRASPLRAASLVGLPPAMMVTAEFDPLRDEGEAYAARLKAAGVPTILRRHDGLIHGFFRMTARLDRARAALEEAAAALRATLA